MEKKNKSATFREYASSHWSPLSVSVPLSEKLKIAKQELRQFLATGEPGLGIEAQAPAMDMDAGEIEEPSPQWKI